MPSAATSTVFAALHICCRSPLCVHLHWLAAAAQAAHTASCQCCDIPSCYGTYHVLQHHRQGLLPADCPATRLPATAQGTHYSTMERAC